MLGRVNLRFDETGAWEREREEITQALQELELSHCMSISGDDWTSGQPQNRGLCFHCCGDCGPCCEELVLGASGDLGDDE